MTRQSAYLVTASNGRSTGAIMESTRNKILNRGQN
jgi:hypothetical protein